MTKQDFYRIRISFILLVCCSFVFLREANANKIANSVREEKVQKPLNENLSFELFLDSSETVQGRIINSEGEPLIGVNIQIKGTTYGTTTDFDGNFNLENVDETSIMIISYIGYETQEITIGESREFEIVLTSDSQLLDEVVVVGFGTQKKTSVVGAMSSVNPSELKIPASNLTTALAGRISGLVAYQTSGEPGKDNAQFLVRGVASFNDQNGPLILIDGVELTADDLARLQPDDIESFSVLKDPTTTAIYGARGANGIILVTTKSGVDGPLNINFRLENSISQPTSMVKMADPITHMNLQNEAERTRGGFATFSEEQIAGTLKGGNPNIYPATDWYQTLFRSFANTSRANLSVRGGGQKARYYVAGSYSKDNGLLNVEKTNNFTNGIDLDRILLRSNIDINLHENTEMTVRLHSTLDNYRGPLQGGNAIFNAAVRTSPTRFLPVYDPDERLEGIPHIIYGNALAPRGQIGSDFSDDGDRPVWFNPYAELQRGYMDTRRQLSLVQLEFKQDLNSILSGLTARFLGNFNTTSYFENRRGYSPYFYRMASFDPFTEEYRLIRTAQASGDESLRFLGGDRVNNSVMYMEAAIQYNEIINDKHSLGGLLVMIGQEYLDGNANTVELSLPSRNVGVSGRYNYGYDDKYFAEFNFGYNGSERFDRDNRFGLFPSFGLGWMLSNEEIFNNLSPTISKIKARASFGYIGNDKIGDGRNDRFFYLSEVDLNSGNGATFGRELNEYIPGISIRRYANPLVTWEKSQKSNVGLEMNFVDDAIQFQVDLFHEKRTNILQERADIPSTLGLQASLKTNVGEVVAKGIDGSLDINHFFNNDFWIVGRGTFTFSDNEYFMFEEPDFAMVGAPWRSKIGNNVSIKEGYIAERLFVDDEDAINSPVQFGGSPGNDYGGGDIKYKDLNGDGVITELDQVPIGKPQIPKITYGLALSTGYKRLDFSVFFQGLSEVTFFIDPITTGPFINSIQEAGINALGDGNGILSENGLMQAYADSYWSENNRDIFAVWPRLSTTVVENNVQSSSWWARDGSFIRLKQAEVGFTVIQEAKNRLGISNLRAYLSGTNLITFSKFKTWDPELGGNGLNYPLQRVVNFGIQANF